MSSKDIIPFRFKAGNKAGVGHGRPPGPSFTSILKEELVKSLNIPHPFTKRNTKLSVQQHLVLRYIAQALKGDRHATEYLFNRIDGKIINPIEIDDLRDKKPTELTTAQLEMLVAEELKKREE